MTHVLPLLLYFLDSAYFVQLVLDFDISNGFPLKWRFKQTRGNHLEFLKICVSYCDFLLQGISK